MREEAEGRGGERKRGEESKGKTKERKERNWNGEVREKKRRE